MKEEKGIGDVWTAFCAKYSIKTYQTQNLNSDSETTLKVLIDSVSIWHAFDSQNLLEARLRDYNLRIIEISHSNGNSLSLIIASI